MICSFLLGYLRPKSSFLFLCWLVGWLYEMSILVRYLIPKSSFFVHVLVGWFYDMSILVRIFNTKVSFFCLCVGWLVS